MSTADLIKPGAIFKYEGGAANGPGWYEAKSVTGQIITTKEGSLLEKVGVAGVLDPAVGDTVEWHVGSNRFEGKVEGISSASPSGVVLRVTDSRGQPRVIHSDRLEVLERAVFVPTQSSKLGGKKMDWLSIDEASDSPPEPQTPKPNHYGSW